MTEQHPSSPFDANTEASTSEAAQEAAEAGGQSSSSEDQSNQQQDLQSSGQQPSAPEATIEQLETRATTQPSSEDSTDDTPTDDLHALNQQVSDLENQLLRSQADMENLRQRHTRQLSDAHKYAVERFSLEVLLLRDHLEMGLESLQKIKTQQNGDDDPTVGNVLEGFSMVLNNFSNLFERFDIKEIECDGKLFDPNLHEAVGQTEEQSLSANHVATVKRKGYTIGDRLLRPALVIVSK